LLKTNILKWSIFSLLGLVLYKNCGYCMKNNSSHHSLFYFLLLLFLALGQVWAQLPDVAGRTVHFLAPWEGIGGVQIRNGDYNMQDDGDGWYSYTFDGSENIWGGWYFIALKLGTLDSDWDKKYGTNGWTATADNEKFGDDIFQGQQEIWIIPDAITTQPRYSTSAPVYLHVLNPEDWSLGAPMISINGGAPQMMEVDMNNCGWFTHMFLTDDAQPTSVYFQDVNSGETFGSQFGYGDNTPWNLVEMYTHYATTDLWFELEDGIFSASNPDVQGECTYSMAMIIRDFSFDHPDFQDSRTCGELQRNMLSPTISNGTPQTGSNTCAAQLDWFSESSSATITCVDVDFSKTSDGLWEYDSFREESGNFFPADDFLTLESGGANPNYSLETNCLAIPRDPDALDEMTAEEAQANKDDLFQWITDGDPRQGQHNFSFCAETHADFVYHAGQKFSFRGDDDVWVYLNGQLVIDLGGTHVPLPESVLLDTVGQGSGNTLVEGQTYSFDLFMCERQTCGSNLRMKTSIYFEQREGLFFERDGDTFQILKVEGGTGDCRSLRSDEGEVIIDGADLNLTFTLVTSGGDTVNVESAGVTNGRLLPGNVYFGGIDLSVPGQISIDEDALSGLAPSRYRLIIQEEGDLNVKEKITFTVAGNLVVDTTAVAREIPGEISMEALAGDLIPLYIKNGAGDFIDETDMGYILSYPEGIVIYDDAAGSNEIPQGQQLNTGSDGVDTVWVTGTKATDSEVDYLINIYRGRGAGVRILFHIPRLRLVDGLEEPWTEVDAEAAAAAMGPYAVGDTIYIEAYHNDYGHCYSCQDTLSMLDATPGLTFENFAGRPVEYVVLDSGAVGLIVSADENVSDGEFTAQGPSILMSVSLSGIDLIVPPTPGVELAEMFDDNNDGRGDRMRLAFDRSIRVDEVDTLFWFWPASLLQEEEPEGERYTGTELLSSYLVDGSDSIVEFTYAEGFSDEILTGEDGAIWVYATFVDSLQDPPAPVTVRKTGVISERIPPVALHAMIAKGESVDTLTVQLSEPVLVDSVTADEENNLFEYIMLRDVRYQERVEALAGFWNDTQDEVTLLYMEDGDRTPEAKDSLRIANVPGVRLLSDLNGLAASEESPWILIEGQRTSGVGSYEEPLVFDPSDPEFRAHLEENGAIWPQRVSMYSSVEELVEDELGVQGFLLKNDLAEYYNTYREMFPDLQKEDVVQEYTFQVFTNLGTYVAGQEGKEISCADDFYNGDCTLAGNNGFLFLGWNMATDEERIVGTGAYVARLQSRVIVMGDVLKTSEKLIYKNWGVRRVSGGRSWCPTCSWR
jgi:fibro-slime domain-containing protein